MSAAAGLDVRPLYPRLAEDPPQPWRERANWSVAQRIDHPDAEAANALALADLEGGADALAVVGAASPGARGFGLVAAEALPAALRGVELDLLTLRLDAGGDTPAFAESLAALIAARRLGGAGLDIDCGHDPVAFFARTRREPLPGDLERVLAAASDAGLTGRPLVADARVWHEAGAAPARELGLLLATAVSHWRALVNLGLSLAEARRAVAVLLPFDADVLVGLARARAMRRLWARLEAACGLEQSPLRLHAETSWRMMTRHDPWTNAMRTTAAAFAAGLGGVDGVTVLPMTLAAGLPDAAARRLARNTDRVLLDESGLGQVDDAAAGSGAVEALTAELCAMAWAQFQDVERGGGIDETLRDGTLPRALAEDAARRRAEVATLARGIVGTSRYPALDVPSMAVLAPPRASVDAGGLPSRRDAEPFEVLRDRAERGSVPPRVVLATLGSPAAFGPAAALAGHLLAAAGIACEPAPALARTPAETLAAFRADGGTVACLCAAASAYEADGAALAASLAKAGARLVLVVDGAVEGAVSLMSRGDDVLAVLAATLTALDR